MCPKHNYCPGLDLPACEFFSPKHNPSDEIIKHIQAELTRLVAIAELNRDTASVDALLRAKQEIAGKS